MELYCSSKPYILLTGAGFTHNFGAPLADQMWSWIFNGPEVKSADRVHALLRDNFDYEDAYHKVMTGTYTVEEKTVIHNAVLQAYVRIDDIMRKWSPGSGPIGHINKNKINELLALFAGNKRECGFFFTLNQDLFAERHYTGAPSPSPLMPGISYPKDVPRFSPTFLNVLIDRNNRCILPKEEEVEEKAKADLRNAHFCYVKLHGSHDWQRHDGSPQLVIGGGKEEIISREPILRWNWKLFETVLRQGNRRLIVVGYGFRDEHVNKETINSIENHGLRLIILNPDKPKMFFHDLLLADRKYGNRIWNGLEGYFQHKLEELFPMEIGSTTDEAKLFFNAITE